MIQSNLIFPYLKVNWLKGCRDITNSLRTVKEAHNDYIRFSFKEAQESDSGIYFIVARNKHGVDRTFVSVSVNIFFVQFSLGL